jgi:hypothetical protein
MISSRRSSKVQNRAIIKKRSRDLSQLKKQDFKKEEMLLQKRRRLSKKLKRILMKTKVRKLVQKLSKFQSILST